MAGCVARFDSGFVKGMLVLRYFGGMVRSVLIVLVVAWGIRVITKLPNTEQSSKGKDKTHKSTNRQNQSTTGKLGKPQWP